MMEIEKTCIEKLVVTHIEKWTDMLETVMVSRAYKGFLSKKEIREIFEELKKPTT